MNLKKCLNSCSIFFLLATIACSSDHISTIEPVEKNPEVHIITPIDPDGILNKVEANAVIVAGTSTLKDGYIVTLRFSDGENSVAGTAVVKEGKWVTESLSISNFSDGEIAVTAMGTNELGTLSNTSETSLYLDQVSPTLGITGPIAENDIIDSNEAAAVEVKGTSDAADNQKVLITFGDHTANHLTTETSVKNGQWKAQVDISSLKSGSLMLMAEVSDPAGNPTTEQRTGVTLK